MSESDLLDIEKSIGTPLPSLLKRIYSEIANGGFGPALGLVPASSLLYTDHNSGKIVEYWPGVPCRHTSFEDRELILPLALIPIAEGGCQILLHIACFHSDFPVLEVDEDCWPEPPMNPELFTIPEEICTYFGAIISPSFNQWMADWLASTTKQSS